MATRNRYAELMAQYQQAQPFSFTGYPSTYTGGYDTTPYQAYSAPVNRYEEIMSQPAMGGGGGRGTQETSEPRYNPLSPLATPESGSLGFQLLDAYGNTKVLPYAWLSGLISQNMLTDQLSQAGKNAAKAYADAKAGYAAGTMFGAPSSDASTFAGGGFGVPGAMTTPTGAGIPASPMSVDPAQAAQAIANAQASGGGRNGGGGYSGAPSGGSDVGRSAPGSAHYAQGGHVSMQHLGGPDPEGPDDGYAALKDGEYVINDKAVKKYGIELMQAINSGKISKGKLRGLLEM